MVAAQAITRRDFSPLVPVQLGAKGCCGMRGSPMRQESYPVNSGTRSRRPQWTGNISVTASSTKGPKKHISISILWGYAYLLGLLFQGVYMGYPYPSFCLCAFWGPYLQTWGSQGTKSGCRSSRSIPARIQQARLLITNESSGQLLGQLSLQACAVSASMTDACFLSAASRLCFLPVWRLLCRSG